MMRSPAMIGLCLASVVSAVVLFGGSFPSRAQSAMDPAQVTARIEAAYPVKVLTVREIEDNGRPAYAVVVMNEGGDFNEAFQVNTIVVDRETGKPISQFRQGVSGREDNSGLSSREWPRRGRTRPPDPDGQ